MMSRMNRSGRLAVIAGSAALAGLLAAGCSKDETPPTTTVTTPAAPDSTTVVTPGGSSTLSTPPGPDTKINTNAGAGTSNGTDTATAAAINKAVVQNKQMTGSRVEAVVTGGVATLNGQVQNQMQKALAEKAASQTSGVTSVKNKLIIVTTGGAKPKPQVITKTKTVVVHDKALAAPPSDKSAPMTPGTTTPNDANTNSATPPAPPTDSAMPAPTAPTPK